MEHNELLKEKKVLELVLQGRWFDMILSGEKKEEYRDLTHHWRTRLRDVSNGTIGKFKQFDVVRFRHGYQRDTREMIVECNGISVGSTKEEWAPEGGKLTYVISLGNILSTKNIK